MHPIQELNDNRRMISAPRGGSVAPSRSQAPNPNDMSRLLSSFMNSLRHWWKIGLPIGIVLGSLAAGLVWLTFTPVYRSEATVMIRENVPFVYDAKINSQKFVLTQIQLFRANSVLSQVVADKDASQAKEIAEGRDPVSWLRQQINVRPIGGSEIYSISISASTPKSAQSIVDAVVTAYISEVRNKQSNRADEMIKKLLDEEKYRREQVEKQQLVVQAKIKELKQTDPTFAISPAGMAEVSRSSSALETQLFANSAEIELKTTRLKALRENPIPPPELTAEEMEQLVESRPEVQKLIESLEVVKQKMADYETKAKNYNKLARYREYQEIARKYEVQLQETRDTIREAALKLVERENQNLIDQQISALEEELEVYNRQNTAILAKLKAAEVERGDIGNGLAKLYFEQTKLDGLQEVLDHIGNRLLELTTEKAAPEFISKQDSASLPTEPVEITPWKKMIGAFTIAFVAPFGLLFFLEKALHRVSDSEALEEANIRVIGEIAKIPRVGGELSERAATLFEESVNSLRTSLQLSSQLKGVQVMAIVSAVSGEGKTSLSAQLAVSIAKSTGQSVLLIDGDMRAPDIHDLFDLENEVGLANVLTELAGWDDAVKSVEGISLDVLPSGSLAKCPHTVVGAGAFSRLIEVLRTHYTYIVIDTPPLLVASEGLVFAAAADASIVCALKNRSRSKQVLKAYTQLVDAGANPIGVVLAGVSHPGYYYSNYGYGYGYVPRR